MDEVEQLDEAGLRAAIVGYRDALRAHQERLNRLNVYPVPDGDTGTNMALTLESVVAELEGAEGMEATCKAVSKGSLMGARGNSGVILSQILRGFAGAIAPFEAVGGKVFAEALGTASDAAYQAVMEPVEGTILTVVREAAEAVADHPGSLAEVIGAAATAAAVALERTPELLPVLAEAGVVDAGGAGFVLFFDALLNVTTGRPVPQSESVPAPVSDRGSAKASGGAVGSSTRYEVMYFLEGPDAAIPEFKQRWAEMGDSIVVVGGDGIWNCHIHTNDIGRSIEAALEAGRPRHIRVTDLEEQVQAQSDDGGASQTDGCRHPQHVTTAVVAIALGEGIEHVYRELGAQQVVSGGQTMNPSTAEILSAVEATHSEAVIVLPNNSNIVAVAEQVRGLASKPVAVVPTEGVIEGLAALLQYDAKAELEANAGVMATAADAVTSGEVTQAVRAASSSAGPVTEGDWLGLSGGKLVVVRSELAGAACALLEGLVGDDHELVTVVEGKGAAPKDTEQVRQWLEANRPNVSVEVHDWGHPLSAYLFSIE